MIILDPFFIVRFSKKFASELPELVTRKHNSSSLSIMSLGAKTLNIEIYILITSHMTNLK
jgi:hypothetical protein